LIIVLCQFPVDLFMIRMHNRVNQHFLGILNHWQVIEVLQQYMWRSI
jgi:hypothetical protein